MSKSMNNYIGLLEPPEAIREKLKTAATCEHRQRRSDPGHPEHCNIFTMHQAFSKSDDIALVDRVVGRQELDALNAREFFSRT